jgi:hypothetical protein
VEEITEDLVPLETSIALIPGVTQILTTVVTLPFVPAPTASSSNDLITVNDSPNTAAPIVDRPTSTARNTQLAPVSVVGSQRGSNDHNEATSNVLVRTLVLGVGESTTVTIATNGVPITHTIVSGTTLAVAANSPQMNQATGTRTVLQQSTISANV